MPDPGTRGAGAAWPARSRPIRPPRHKAPQPTPTARRPARPTAGDVHAALDAFAPFRNAAEWDNVGLLLGRPEWPARRALLTIDLTDQVAREALRRGADVVVAYHPPIFKSVRCVGPEADGPTTLLADLLAERVSVIAVHTACDAAVGGTNDVLLDAVGSIVERRPLEPLGREHDTCKLVAFVPEVSVASLRTALSAAGAGVIGHYRDCSFELPGTGTFRGDETTRPAVGRRQVLERVAEVRLEMVVPRSRLAGAVRALYAAHPYEEPAFDVYPLHELPGRGGVGMGRVGVLAAPLVGHALVRRLRSSVDLSAATIIGSLGRRFGSVTAAAGSSGARGFRDADSLVLTGELKHHEALELHRRGVSAVCMGHHASERPVLGRIAERLRAALSALDVVVSREDRAPQTPLRRTGR
ncbi:MAG TPA: Nif3-like dinuclear metal center hexameric protein [Phycisphaerae bacterium]|nr:Nif3-like dinuclear metal center hexameric protein [Phycisphaerae bacterium]